MFGSDKVLPIFYMKSGLTWIILAEPNVLETEDLGLQITRV